MNQIHGHEVIQVLFQLQPGCTKEEAVKSVSAHFGAETLFCSCSEDNMSAEGIVSFFENKGKVTFTDAGLQFGMGGGCNH